MSFTVKDSGERMQFDSGMVRDTTEGKIDYSLVLDGPMFKRWAEHLTKGAVKYEPRNWMKARGLAELLRFKASAFRHFLQWFWGDADEDHAAAVFFNINGAEYVKDRMKSEDPADLAPGAMIEVQAGSTLAQRLDAGMSLEEALREPECETYCACGRGCCG